MEYEPSGNDKAELEELEKYFLYYEKPMNFNPYDPASVIMSNERSFEDVCTVLEEQGIEGPKQLTEHEFYSKLTYFEKKFKKAEDAVK